ncbi:hypothetical protein AAMO2058_001306600 [Amorphochlora amoebiformis]
MDHKDYYNGSTDMVETSVNDLLREREALTPDSTKIVFVMVGCSKPERLNTALRLQGFLRWRGADAKVFEVESKDQDLEQSIEGILQWMKDGGEMAIFDAENGTIKRRALIAKQFKTTQGNLFDSIGVVFIEIIPLQLESRIHFDVSPRAKELPSSGNGRAKSESVTRIRSTPMLTQNGFKQLPSPLTVHSGKDIKTYETIETDSRHSYLKIFSEKHKMQGSRVYGRITKSILPFLMATSHRRNRPIWLVRAGCAKGETRQDVNDPRLVIQTPNPQRNAELDTEGVMFAKWLSDFVERRTKSFRGLTHVRSLDLPRLIDGRSDKKDGPKRIKIMCSTLQRSIQTANAIGWAGEVEIYNALDPLDKGLFPGLKFTESHTRAPEFYHRWKKDKYNTRFPAGESYHDLRMRLETCLIELEQQSTPVLVIAHGTTLQVLQSYFTGKDTKDCWKVNFPHHTVMEYTPTVSSSSGMWSIRSYAMESSSKLKNAKKAVGSPMVGGSRRGAGPRINSTANSTPTRPAISRRAVSPMLLNSSRRQKDPPGWAMATLGAVGAMGAIGLAYIGNMWWKGSVNRSNSTK